MYLVRWIESWTRSPMPRNYRKDHKDFWEKLRVFWVEENASSRTVAVTKQPHAVHQLHSDSES